MVVSNRIDALRKMGVNFDCKTPYMAPIYMSIYIMILLAFFLILNSRQIVFGSHKSKSVDNLYLRPLTMQLVLIKR